MFCTTSQARGETRSIYRRLSCKINDARRFNVDKAPSSPGRVANVTHSTSLNCKRRFITSTNCVLSDYISHEHMARPRSSRHSSRYRQSRITHHSHACHTLYNSTSFSSCVCLIRSQTNMFQQPATTMPQDVTTVCPWL